MPITFTTQLTNNHWNETVGGWECSALRIPGAKVTGLYSQGQRQDTVKYEVPAKSSQIRWHQPQKPPPEVVVSIELERKLFSWVGTGAISAFASVVVALITGYFSLAAAQSPSHAADPASDSTPAADFTRWHVFGELDFAGTTEHQKEARLLLEPPLRGMLPENKYYVEFCEGTSAADAEDVYIVVQNEGFLSKTIPVSDYVANAENYRIEIPKVHIEREPEEPYQPSDAQ